MRHISKIALVIIIAGLVPAVCFAEDSKPKQDTPQVAAPAPASDIGSSIGKGLACLGAGVAAIGGGFAVARIGGNCLESMARQPEAASSMFAPMIVTAAMVEGGMLFAIVVCLLGVLG